ncbi:DEAD/DEAH box helicase family protein [Paenibacillus sp. FSL H7-0942]|uniref:DEAD/DEAH box helicase n=1 Tax=Paenibacillus sp. FSL H7-0942 TaxID=2921444 RepID=UPI003246155F
MRFDDILSRADEQTLQEILGANTIRVLTILDETQAYNKYIKELVINLFGKEGLLLDKKKRMLILDLLRESEAKELVGLLYTSPEYSDLELYSKLKKHNFNRGSMDEEKLFRFFDLVPPLIEEIENVQVETLVEGKYTLFPHQREAVTKVKKLLYNEPFRVLLHMPTGSGKTRTAMNIIAEHLRNNEPTVVVWLAGSEELCSQATDEFEKSWSFLGNRDLNVYKYWGNNKIEINNIYDGFIVVGLPKITSALKDSKGISLITLLANKTSLIVMDEAHQAVAPTFKTVIDSLFYIGNPNRLLGLSATPGRTWNDVNADEELSNFFSKQKVRLDVQGYANPIDYLVDEGYLAKVKYRDLTYDRGVVSVSDLKSISASIDIPLNVLKKLGKDDQRNLMIIETVENLILKHKRVLIFAPSVENSNLLACILQARGHIAHSVTSHTTPNMRREIIKEYKHNSKEPRIICNYGVLTTGFDAPNTSAAVIARPTLSLVLYSQMIGRAIRGRRVGGNLEAEIVTVIDTNLPGFRSVSESFVNWEDVWE